MPAAIYFHPEGYTTRGPKLMGRNAAGESFLRGWLQHGHGDSCTAQVDKSEHAAPFLQAVHTWGRGRPARVVDAAGMSALAQAGALYCPGPDIGHHAWQRAAFGHGSWSLCGITHTTSSSIAMDAICDLLTTPVQPWDALICTSSAVRDNVQRLLQGQGEYLRERLGATRLVLPQLPVIPLGIHTEDFAFTAAQRAAARQALGADERTQVVSFVGRLSFHAKAHPLAMYQALEMAAQRSGLPVMLVECGWHANDAIGQAFAEAARLACPSVRVVTLDGRDAAARTTAWAAADVFCSLSDNVQETFGIAPIEAMAAGLPVVVSDWDGYRDTVRDGIDGFRVATTMPAAGLGTDLALRHALQVDTYDRYCGHACSFVAVDIPATAAALARLFESPALRRQMGDAGRERARSVYDWKAVMAGYEALWDELAERRRAAAASLPRVSHPWPARRDPFALFTAYPTHTLTPETRLALAGTDLDAARVRLAELRALAMVRFADGVLGSEPEVQALLQAAAQGPASAQALMHGIIEPRRPLALRTLAWLLKLGVLETRD